MKRHMVSSRHRRPWCSLLPPAPARAALAGAALAAATTLVAGGTPAAAATSPGAAPPAAVSPGAASPGAASPAVKAACPAAGLRHARCLTLYRPEVAVNRAIAAGVRGLAAQP